MRIRAHFVRSGLAAGCIARADVEVGLQLEHGRIRRIAESSIGFRYDRLAVVAIHEGVITLATHHREVERCHRVCGGQRPELPSRSDLRVAFVMAKQQAVIDPCAGLQSEPA